MGRVKLIFFMGMILTLIGGYFSFQLYSNLRTNLEELLPTSSRSVRDLNELSSRLLSIDNLAVLIFSKNTEASKRFVVALASRLQTFPKEEVAGIEYRIDRELEFFKKRQALYIDLNDLTQIRNYVQHKIDYEKSLYNPLNIISGENLLEPKLDFKAIQTKYESKASHYSHFPSGFFASTDEKKRVILINTPGKSIGINGIKQLKIHVDQAITNLNPKSYSPDIEIHYTGSVEETLEEQESLIEDLAISTVIVLFLVSGVMLLFFRHFWPTLALILSLLGGTLWTFGLSYFVVGYLNANSAFLGSIVLGNGVNFGIILLARYLEERRSSAPHFEACRTAISTTWQATLTAALAAGLSYGSLILTSFRGFNQFGIIGFIGMILCWICTYTFLPSILTLFEWISPIQTQSLEKKRSAPFISMVATAVSRWPGLIVALSLLFTGFSALSISRVNGDILETNLKNLRSKKSIEKGAAFYNNDLNEIFKHFLTPLVILPSSRDHAIKIASQLEKLRQSQGSSSEIISVQTIDQFVPKDQPSKIKLLLDIRTTLKPQIIQRLSTQDRVSAETLLSPEVFHEIQTSNLPPLIRDKFMEKNGALGNLVVVEPPLTEEIWAGRNLERFIETIRSVADSVQPGTPVAGGMAITSDLVTSISHDGPRATLLALVSVLLLVIILFRDPKIWLPTLSSLLIGVIWFAGMIITLAASGLKINFLNFVALPITFGIGVDYGVNIFQRYRQQSDQDIIRVIRETGGAVALSSITTIIGYSSLLMASNQGFVSFGLLAVLGEITCVTAAIVVLPAGLALWHKSGVHRKSPPIELPHASQQESSV